MWKIDNLLSRRECEAATAEFDRMTAISTQETIALVTERILLSEKNVASKQP